MATPLRAAPTPQALQAALNSSTPGALSAVLEAGEGLDPAVIERRRSALLQRVPDAQWPVTAGAPLRDGRPTTDVLVTGSRQQGPYKFRFEARQQLVLGSNGQRYDLDVVFDDPLNGAIAAGAIKPISINELLNLQSPDLQLEALGGGGLFKTVQAPYQPGSQTWGVLLVHPKGIVAASKQVRIVADKNQLNP